MPSGQRKLDPRGGYDKRLRGGRPIQFVIVGLDPAIHLAKKQDAQVKPAHGD
jgi:hypothetical protein